MWEPIPMRKTRQRIDKTRLDEVKIGTTKLELLEECVAGGTQTLPHYKRMFRLYLPYKIVDATKIILAEPELFPRGLFYIFERMDQETVEGLTEQLIRRELQKRRRQLIDLTFKEIVPKRYRSHKITPEGDIINAFTSRGEAIYIKEVKPASGIYRSGGDSLDSFFPPVDR